jgi:hypothetical protein
MTGEIKIHWNKPHEKGEPVTPIFIFTAKDSKNRFAENHLFSCVRNLFGRYGNDGFSGRYVTKLVYWGGGGGGDRKALESLHFPSQ